MTPTLIGAAIERFFFRSTNISSMGPYDKLLRDAILHNDLSKAKTALAGGANPHTTVGMPFRLMKIPGANNKVDLPDLPVDGGNESAIQFATIRVAKTRSSDFGMYGLTFATLKGPIEMVDLLLEHGALVNHRDSFGQTPIMAAAFRGHKTIVEKLISEGAHVWEEDSSNLTAADWARIEEHGEVLTLLNGLRN